MDASSSLFAFADVTVDTVAHRIERDGRVLPIEPRVFAVLVELVNHPGELLRKERLLDAVWGHRHVTPGVLNRAVATLRRELGDDSATPRYIETVHGLGYRFIGHLLPVDANARASGTSAPRVHGAAATSTLPMPSPPVPRSAVRRLIRRTILRRTMLLGVLVGSAAVAAMYVFRDPRERPDLPTRNDIAVLPFSVREGNADFAAAAEGLSEELIDALTRTPGLTVIGRDSAYAVRHLAPLDAAEKLDAAYVMSGGVRRVEGRTIVGVSLWKQHYSEPLWSDEHSIAGGPLSSIVAAIVEHTRARLLPDAVHQRSMDEETPARDLYWLGRHYLHRRARPDIEQALSYFRRAIDEDPAYALAWTGVADVHMLLYEYGDLSIDAASLESRTAIARARALAPDLAEAHASEGLLLMNEGDTDAALGALARALALEPKLPEARLWYGNALAYSGRVREALAWHQRAELEDPMNAVLQTYLGVDAMLADDEVLASSYLNRAVELNPSFPEPYWQLALLHIFHGRLEDASKTLDGLTKRIGNTPWNALNSAYVDMLAGDGASAQASIDDAEGVSPLDRIEAGAWMAWLATGSAESWRPAAMGVAAGYAGSPQREAVLARIDLLSGHDGDALARYDRLFRASADRGDPFFRPWLPDLGLGHFAAWIALMPAEDARRTAALDAYARQLARFSAGGLAVPAFRYHEAMLEALRGKCDGAFAVLAVAMAKDWVDEGALRRDPAWRACATSPEYSAAQADLGRRAKEQRARLAVLRDQGSPPG